MENGTNLLAGRLAIFRINYKSDFILTLQSDAGWAIPFCIKFWTGVPSQAYYAGWDGTTYTNCAPVVGEPSKLQVQFDDHHLPIGELKYQIGYHFTVDDFPTTVEDEVINQEAVIIDNNGRNEKVLLDFNGETAPDIQFSLPAYANEAQRIANEEQRIENEQQRIENEQTLVGNEETRIVHEWERQRNEQTRITQEEARERAFTQMQRDSEAATSAANDAATLANSKARLAQEKAEYAQQQGDFAKAQGETAQLDHTKAAADHQTALADHQTAAADHQTAAADHQTAESDHTRAGQDHTDVQNAIAAADLVYDISKAHASGGVLATYTGLADALGTNGANVPVERRQGGMTVKFVLSSDNKYVQYRLMTTSFSTTVTDWQGVDEELIAGSHNLAESGVVKKYVSQLQSEVSAINSGHIQMGKAYKANGELETTSVWFVSTDYTPVKNGDIVVWNPGHTGSSSRSLILYNSNKENIDYFYASKVERTITISNANAAYIRASFYKDNLTDAKLVVNGVTAWKTVESINYIEGQINDIATFREAEEKKEKAQVYLSSNGVLTLKQNGTSLMLKYAGSLMGRGSLDWQYNISALAAELGVSLVDISASDTGYIEILGNYDLAVDFTTLKPVLKSRSSIVGTDLVLIANVDGSIVSLNTDQLGFRYLDGRLVNMEREIRNGTTYFEKELRTSLSHLALNDDNTAIESNAGNFQLVYCKIQAGKTLAVKCLESTGGRFRIGVTLQEPAANVVVSNGQRIDGPTAGDIMYEVTAVSDCYLVLSSSPENVARTAFGSNIPVSDAIDDIKNRTGSTKEDINARFIQSVFANKSNPTGCLSLLHFSDIHGGTENLGRIVAFREDWAQYIDDVICTGDLVSDDWDDTFIFTDSVVNESNKILLCLGNHDVAIHGSGGFDWYHYAGSQDAYTRYMQNCALWGITQPSGTGENNYYPCYYYKDYTDKGVRLVVLDMMDWGKQIANNVADADNPQYVWLQNTLLSARQAGLHIIIAEHFPFWAKGVGVSHPKNADIIESDFTLPNRLSSYVSAYDSEIGGSALLNITQMVEDFKTAGGVFVCWICGHTHFDNFERVTANGQKVIVIGTANYSVDKNTIRSEDDDTIDLFNILSVDSINRVVKVFRIGGHLTPALQKIDTMNFIY